MEYFAIKNWGNYQTNAAMGENFMIRYALGVRRDTAKRGFDGRKEGA